MNSLATLDLATTVHSVQKAVELLPGIFSPLEENVHFSEAIGATLPSIAQFCLTNIYPLIGVQPYIIVRSGNWIPLQEPDHSPYSTTKDTQKIWSIDKEGLCQYVTEDTLFKKQRTLMEESSKIKKSGPFANLWTKLLIFY